MLILSRKVGEEVLIRVGVGGVEVVVTLTRGASVAGGAVKLGFAAPESVTILRREVAERLEVTLP